MTKDAGEKPSALPNLADKTDDVDLPFKPQKFVNRRHDGHLLESLFGKRIDAPTNGTTLLEPYKNVEALQNMLKDGTHAVECWNFFVEHFSPETENNHRRTLPTYLQSTAKQLWNKVTLAKPLTPFSKALPSYAEITRTYKDLGILRVSDWADMMLTLMESILKARTGDTLNQKNDGLLSEDLLASWGIVMDLPPIEDDWSDRLEDVKKDIIALQQRRGPSLSFQLIMPAIWGRFTSWRRQEISKMPIVAIGTFVLLTNTRHILELRPQQWTPFGSLLKTILNVIDNDKYEVTRTLSKSTPDLLAKYITQEWPGIDMRLPFKSKAPDPAVSGTLRSFPGLDVSKRIKIALANKDFLRLHELWEEASQLPVLKESSQQPNSTSRNSSSWETLTANVCDLFILSFMTVRRPNKAVDVWNYMIDAGIDPTVATWNAMLGGCRASNDATTMEEVWEKMENSGTKPDVACWTTRVVGLVDGNRADLALQALDEMRRRWILAITKKHGNLSKHELQKAESLPATPKPAIEVVNAAISGLLRKKDTKTAFQILRWAGELGVKPDLYTYNTLLGHFIRDGRTKEARQLLQQMHDAGHKADAVTFTTIMDDLLSSSNTQTPDQLKENIVTVLSQMEQAGIRANLHIYGKIVYHVVQSQNAGTPELVNFILERMAKDGLQPSKHIYTTLVQHCFEQQPPNIGAARSLIERAQLQPGNTDNIFWDRVIEGYAKAGETSTAMRVLGKIHSRAGAPGWFTLRTLLSALVEGQEWDLARTLVRNTKADQGGPLPEEERGKEGQHQFWRLVEELQLLDS
ncbi:hypothetical protein BJ875DRAFT_436670 [Amylocarpus encephaloides]|uniref:Pentacotripeptide-repeat region of PRORP domain-containing protein n=1 Tax=Amylocarpus encephaloides TaxID=45428 RepID=A0A9P7YT37_9HELO|nr:hypothetical protein BJ875DRAFT_436670 [Amylocarpus encephaloides]